MHRFSKNTSTQLQELDLNECVNISGEDPLTRAVFRYLGSFCAGIMAGQPHAAYGRYAGL